MAAIQYRHLKTNTIYKKVRFFDYAPNLAEVTTLRGSTYIVKRKQIIAERRSK